MKAAEIALVAVHPEYNRIVHEWILADPARKFRDAMDVARMNHSPQEGEAMLRERSDERARLIRGLLEIGKVAAERDSTIGQLNYALEHASPGSWIAIDLRCDFLRLAAPVSHRVVGRCLSVGRKEPRGAHTRRGVE